MVPAFSSGDEIVLWILDLYAKASDGESPEQDPHKSGVSFVPYKVAPYRRDHES